MTLNTKTLDLALAFDIPKDERGTAPDLLYDFRGFVCYYGQHYFAFFYSSAHQRWLLFDDSKVVVVGDWAKVMDKYVCPRGF